jgi:hypothetical protein
MFPGIFVPSPLRHHHHHHHYQLHPAGSAQQKRVRRPRYHGSALFCPPLNPPLLLFVSAPLLPSTRDSLSARHTRTSVLQSPTTIHRPCSLFPRPSAPASVRPSDPLRGARSLSPGSSLPILHLFFDFPASFLQTSSHPSSHSQDKTNLYLVHSSSPRRHGHPHSLLFTVSLSLT